VTNYLRQIAERGAGLHTGAIAPPRVGPSLNLPKIVAPPMHVGAMDDGAIDSTPVDEQPTAIESPPRVDARPIAANATQSPLNPPLSPTRSQPDPIEREDRPIAAASAQPMRVELPAPRRVEERVRVESETAEAKAARPSIEPPGATVRLEPSRAADWLRADTRSTRTSSDEDRPIAERAGPLLVRERIAASAPRADVRVSIGRVDVRVESPPPPTPQSNRAPEPSDPFASLSLARRGWRAPF
jgi:hypothetical protein